VKLSSLLIFSLLPFVQLVLILDTDVSYLVILSGLILLLFGLKKYQKWEMQFVFISLLFSSFLLLSLPVTKAVGPLVFSILLVVYKNYTLRARTLYIALMAYVIAALLFYYDSSKALMIQSYFVGNIKWSAGAQRAFPILGTEAGLMAGVFIMLAELTLIVLVRNKLRLLVALIFLLLGIQTKSGSFLVFIVIFLLNRRLNKKWVLCGIVGCSLAWPFFRDFVLESRIGTLILGSSQSITNLLFFDTSLAYRMSALFSSLEVFFRNLLVIWGDKNEEVQAIYSVKYRHLNPLMDKTIHDVSSLGLILRTGGIVSLLWFLYVIKLLGLSRRLLYLMITLMFSYSLFFPLSLLLQTQKYRNKCAEY
jgi:hypothetical protein